MKRLALLLFVFLLFTLFGCGSSAEPAPSAAPTMPSTVPEMPAEQQKELIMEHYAQWSFTEPWESPWFYTFTDLDHNGRLEVIAACVQGTGFYTYLKIWEVNGDFSDIAECEPAVEEEGASFPDLIIESMPCYHDASSGRYYYICEDMVRGGWAEYYFSTNAICLHDGVFDIQTLASRYEHFSEPEADPEVTYYDASGESSTRKAYESAEEGFAVGKEKTTLTLDWTQVENPFPEEEQIQEADLVGPEVIITKNPRSETVAVGGKTWFIAHADNAISLSWQAVHPDGHTVSLEDAMAANPGLSLETLEGDTIAVSNIPLSFDGWGIQARFDGTGDSNYAVTDPAWITVTK